VTVLKKKRNFSLIFHFLFFEFFFVF